MRGRRWKSWTAVTGVLVFGTLVMLAWSLVLAWTHPPLTPDSWAYILLARSFHSAPYHIPLIRQYQFHSDFCDSFPPVWPLIMFAGSWLHAGPRLGLIVATVLSLALLRLLHILLRPFIRPRGRRRVAAAACWAAIMSFGPFLDEILGGRSIPAALLLYAALVIALTRMTRFGFRAGLLAGAIAGLLWMTRFDAAPTVVLVGLLVPLVSGASARLRWWAGYGLALAIIVAPWVVYSRAAFGVYLASDIAAVARRVAPSTVTDWFPVPVATLKDAPMAWVSRLVSSGPGLADALRRAVVRYSYASSLVAVFAAWTAVQVGNHPRRPGRASRLALLVTTALTVQLAGPLAIGTFDLRYFTPFILAITLWGAGLVLMARTRRFHSMVLAPLVIGLVLGWHKSFSAQRGQQDTFVAVVPADDPEGWPDVSGIPLRTLQRCLPEGARVLVVEPGVPAYLVAYYLGRTSLQVPGNWNVLSRGDRSEFMRQFRVSHVVDTTSSVGQTDDRLQRISGCNGVAGIEPATGG